MGFPEIAADDMVLGGEGDRLGLESKSRSRCFSSAIEGLGGGSSSAVGAGYAEEAVRGWSPKIPPARRRRLSKDGDATTLRAAGRARREKPRSGCATEQVGGGELSQIMDGLRRPPKVWRRLTLRSIRPSIQNPRYTIISTAQSIPRYEHEPVPLQLPVSASWMRRGEGWVWALKCGGD